MENKTVKNRSVGERISYGNDGIFTVVDVRTERIGGVPTEYYVLKRFGDNSASLVYVPKANEKLVAAMKDPMSADEAKEWIARAPSISPVTVSDDPRARADDYKKLLEGGHEDRIALIKTATIWMEKRREEGKKPYLNDETALKKAEKLLYAELGSVLGLSDDEIRKAIVG